MYFKSIPNASQKNPKSFQHSSKIRSKNEPLHVARGSVFSATDDLFSATGDVFEAFGRGAASGCQKGERAGCFWSPRDVPFWSKSAKQSPRGAQKDPKIRKKAIQKSMQKMMPKKGTKCIPKAIKIMPKRTHKSLICHAFAKKAEMLQTVCFQLEDVVLGTHQLRNIR